MNTLNSGVFKLVAMLHPQANQHLYGDARWQLTSNHLEQVLAQLGAGIDWRLPQAGI